ncbi:hypothetical protein AB0M48_38765 [Lentzea sp. NPDC051208]|uniref:hypothetical protein n=1 Tax=Lentzea sp. NPDC051208 TaxID=3154642 RepID=UPI0034204731
MRTMRGTVPEVRSAVFAAIGALTRNDAGTAQAVLHQLACRRDITTSIAADALAEVVLTALPRQGPGVDLRCVLLAEFQRWVPGSHVSVAHAAADIASRVAERHCSAKARTYHLPEGTKGMDVLLVLAGAAAARIKRFVDLDSQAVEAYFAHRRRAEADHSGLGRYRGVL